MTFNRLSDLVETDKATGQFVSNISGKTKTSPFVQIGAGVQHRLMTNTIIALDASVAYAGGFETDNTRSGNMGITEIAPYKIDEVWRANLGASLKLEF